MRLSRVSHVFVMCLSCVCHVCHVFVMCTFVRVFVMCLSCVCHAFVMSCVLSCVLPYGKRMVAQHYILQYLKLYRRSIASISTDICQAMPLTGRCMSIGRKKGGVRVHSKSRQAFMLPLFTLVDHCSNIPLYPPLPPHLLQRLFTTQFSQILDMSCHTE